MKGSRAFLWYLHQVVFKLKGFLISDPYSRLFTFEHLFKFPVS
jgi:hypothetical protein